MITHIIRSACVLVPTSYLWDGRLACRNQPIMSFKDLGRRRTGNDKELNQFFWSLWRREGSIPPRVVDRVADTRHLHTIQQTPRCDAATATNACQA